MEAVHYKLNEVSANLHIDESCHIMIQYDAVSGELKKDLRFIIERPSLTIRIDVKIIARNSSSTICNLLGIIEQSATNTDLYIAAKTLIVDSKAHVSITPSLEIKHNDVKAGHGASIGYVNPQELWYLQSHGFSEEKSEEILVEAFLN